MSDDIVKRLRGTYSTGPFGKRDFEPYIPGIQKEAADEIERLRAELNGFKENSAGLCEAVETWGRRLDRARHVIDKREAQLAVMRGALEKISRAKQIFEGTWVGDVVEQALATDAGKAAADVLAAADLWKRAEYDMRPGPERTDLVRAKKIKLRDAVRAYRAKQ